MEELNLKELLIYYMKKISIIFLFVILGISLGLGYIEFIQTPKYKGITTIILVENSGNRTDSYITQTEIMANEKLVTTYSEIIKSKRILNKVITELQLKITAEELSENIEVLSVEDTTILEIEVKNENKILASAIANKIAEIFIEEITKIYNLENVSIIDKADVAEEPYNVKLPLQLCIFGGSGLVISIFILTTMFYFDTTIKNKQEVESKLNLSVIGEIPTIDKSTIKKIKKNQKRLKILKRKRRK